MGKRSLQVKAQFQEKANNARIGLGLTQKMISIRLECSRQPVSRFFNCKPVSYELFVGICKLLNLDWQEITGIKSSNAHLTNQKETTNQSTIDINSLVNTIREQVKADIENRCGTMRILDMSHPIGLNDIYTKVNILEKISGRRRKNIDELIDNFELENFERFNFGEIKEKIPGKEAVSKYRTLMILGKPGAGKTTFLKHLVIQCSRGLFQGELVPFFITLKEFAEVEEQPKLKLFDYLAKYINDDNKEDLDIILKNGKALICLDGLDEVLQKDTNRVIKEIEQLALKYPQNQYLMTCRIAAKEYTFTQFTEVEIADFDWEQITIFANNWFENKLIKAYKFLGRLEKDKPIQELASNPLLVTLLCLTFEESGDFPGNRAGLYKEGIDALLKKWDAKRGIERDEVYQKLWTQRKEDLLSKIAWNTFSQGEYFFKQDKVERYIGEYIRNLAGANTDEEALKLDSEAVLKSIESQHGLFIERAKHIYSFSHLTFQEYFTARKIVTTSDPESFKKHITQLINEFDNINDDLKTLFSFLMGKFRWKEVFLLVLQMVSCADYILISLKKKIDRSVAKSIPIQKYLQWLNNKTNQMNLEYSKNYLRLFFWDSYEYRTQNVFFKELNKIQPNGIHHYDSVLYGESSILGLFDVLDRASQYGWFYLINKYKFILESLLKQKNKGQYKNRLLKLYNEIPLIKTKLPKQDVICKKWWKKEGENRVQQLRTIINELYDNCYDWNFNKRQVNLLSRYKHLNHFLVECLYCDCYISPEVRQEIEETLFLPYVEIEKRNSKISS